MFKHCCILNIVKTLFNEDNIMKNTKNLSQLHKDISGKLLDSIRLLEILETLNDGEPRNNVIIDILNRNINSAFNSISKCRKIISVTD